MEESKHKSRKEGESKRSHRDREKEKKVDRHRDKDRGDKRDSRRDTSSDSEERYTTRDKHRDKDVDRVRSRDDERERGKSKKRDKEKEREREKIREKEKRERKEREREKEKERERKEREREKEKEKERERKERAREAEKREKEKERAKRRRERETRTDDDDSDGSEVDVKERDRKRHKKSNGESKERDRERSVGRSSRHQDDEIETPKKKGDGDDSEKVEKLSREEELEAEQQKLDDEMEKQRRRVQEWQELKRKKEEDEREKHGVENVDEAKSGKEWTLDGESDDEEAGKAETVMEVDTEVNADHLTNGEITDAVMPDGDADADAKTTADADAKTTADADADAKTTADAAEEDEVDPLDAFMLSMVIPEVEKLNTAVELSSVDDKNKEKKVGSSNGEKVRKTSSKKAMGRIIPGEDSDSDYGDLENDDNSVEEDDDEFIKRVTKTKAEKLALVDHSKIDYQPFRKNFYIEVKEISRMTPDEVGAYRKELELKIHGKDVPKPIKSWHQTGLTGKVLDTIKKLNYEKPMPIQAQALPIVMSGRDCIGIGKTGSGKTLAFVLPMLRHIKDQEPVGAGDGPIGLIMAPTRELVQQIHGDIKKFAKVMGLRCVPVYGGSGVAQQISDLKRGAEIVVCTPGRMIDILCTSGGKITNLRRVTYLVMDEADRMFDMGFEPQITRIVQNIRPGRQTVLFSATFPRQVEVLARKVLDKPVEIQVGGRSVVNKDITQLVEVRQESERFLRLLELLGEWYEKGKILIFVQSQDKCDSLFRDLLKHGYPCLSLHGAKDQTDRESTVSDFKSNVCNLLVATSIAARGLDVKDLELVINFDAPNHYEDYVHRVGRTGRAGKKGCAITFISEDDARYAPDLVKALELSEQVVPDDLKSLADNFMAQVKQGLAQAHGTGFGGTGFKFNVEEDEAKKAAKKAQAKQYGFEEDKSDSEDEDDGIRKSGGDISQQTALAEVIARIQKTPVVQLLPDGGLPVPLPGVPTAVVPGTPGLPLGGNEAAARVQAITAAMNLKDSLLKLHQDAMREHYEAELEINDFAQNARWRVTHKDTLGPISEFTGAAITTRGQYFPSGKVAGPGDRKLYLFIEGPTEQSVKSAKAQLKKVLDDMSLSLPGGNQPGRYQVI